MLMFPRRVATEFCEDQRERSRIIQSTTARFQKLGFIEDFHAEFLRKRSLEAPRQAASELLLNAFLLLGEYFFGRLNLLKFLFVFGSPYLQLAKL